MKLSTRIATAVLLVVGSTGAVYALSKHGDWQMTPAEKVEFVTDRVSKKLELDASQRQKFAEFADLLAQAMLEVRGTRDQHRQEIAALLDEPSFNQARALELITEKTRQVDEKAPLLVSALAGFLDSLNAEQRAELRDFVEHHRHHRGHRRHEHGE